MCKAQNRHGGAQWYFSWKITQLTARRQGGSTEKGVRSGVDRSRREQYPFWQLIPHVQKSIRRMIHHRSGLAGVFTINAETLVADWGRSASYSGQEPSEPSQVSSRGFGLALFGTVDYQNSTEWRSLLRRYCSKESFVRCLVRIDVISGRIWLKSAHCWSGEW